MINFSGKWQTTFGPLELLQSGARVRGSYVYLGIPCSVEGKVKAGRLIFHYQEPTVHGEGWFDLCRRGQAFAGQFRAAGNDVWESWTGERIGFDGLWNSTFGLMRLIESADDVRGFYEVEGSASIVGRRDRNRLSFDYREPKARGRGRFELADDGLSFQGEWKPLRDTTWRPWTGIRVRPQPDLHWLVVLEAPWQRFLSDREYSFGNMLREFFARVPNVQVRHRFFANEAGLRRSCRDLLYMAEPVVLVVATHAQPEGITVDGQTIALDTLFEPLRYTSNIRLLHFSACLLMHDPMRVQGLRAFARETGLPISGYRTSVDWAASAIIEFTYLDLILARNLSPVEAARQLTKLLPFAGDREVRGTALRPAGFTLVLPNERASKRASPITT